MPTKPPIEIENLWVLQVNPGWDVGRIKWTLQWLLYIYTTQPTCTLRLLALHGIVDPKSHSLPPHDGDWALGLTAEFAWTVPNLVAFISKKRTASPILWWWCRICLHFCLERSTLLRKPKLNVQRPNSKNSRRHWLLFEYFWLLIVYNCFVSSKMCETAPNLSAKRCSISFNVK